MLLIINKSAQNLKTINSDSPIKIRRFCKFNSKRFIFSKLSFSSVVRSNTKTVKQSQSDNAYASTDRRNSLYRAGIDEIILLYLCVSLISSGKHIPRSSQAAVEWLKPKKLDKTRLKMSKEQQEECATVWNLV